MVKQTDNTVHVVRRTVSIVEIAKHVVVSI